MSRLPDIWNNLNLRWKLLILGLNSVFWCVLVLGGVGLWQAVQLGNTAYEAADRLIADDLNQVMTGVLHLVQAYAQTDLAGRPPEELPALRNALQTLHLGISGGGYVLRGSGIDRGRYLLSPNGNLDGKLATGARDVSGQLYIQEMLTAAIKQPGSVITASFTLADENGQSDLWLARAVYFAPWDWVILIMGNEAEMNPVDAQIVETRQTTLVIMTIAVVYLTGAGIGFNWLFGRSITTPVQSMVRAAQRLAQGEVNQVINYHSHDEVGNLADSFRGMLAYLQEIADLATNLAAGRLNHDAAPRSEHDVLGQAFEQMIIDLRSLVGAVATQTTTLETAAEHLSDAAAQSADVTAQIAATISQIAQGVQQQTESASVTAASGQTVKAATEHVASGAQEQTAAVRRAAEVAARISAGIAQVAAGAQAGTQAAVEANRVTDTGAVHVRTLLNKMTVLQTSVIGSAEKVAAMHARSTQVGAIVESIRDIAGQTNLLALNAAIEAARLDAQSAAQVEKMLDNSLTAVARLAGQTLPLLPETDQSVETWTQFAQLAGIEVVCITDADGVVVHSNQPDYRGFRFSDKPQSPTFEFRRLLTERDGVVCQPIQPRQKDKLPFKFVGVSRADQPGLIQVGLPATSALRHKINAAGFGVVADEVRQLADRTATATKEITALLHSIQTGASEASAAMTTSAQEAADSAALAHQAGQALTATLAAAQHVRAQVEGMAAAAADMNAGAHDLNAAMTIVSTVAGKNTADADALTTASTEIAQAVETIASVSQENGAAVEQVSASTQELTAQSAQVRANAAALTQMAQQLLVAVQRFELEVDAPIEAGPPARPQPPAPMVSPASLARPHA